MEMLKFRENAKLILWEVKQPQEKTQYGISSENMKALLDKAEKGVSVAVSRYGMKRDRKNKRKGKEVPRVAREQMPFFPQQWLSLKLLQPFSYGILLTEQELQQTAFDIQRTFLSLQEDEHPPESTNEEDLAQSSESDPEGENSPCPESDKIVEELSGSFLHLSFRDMAQNPLNPPSPPQVRPIYYGKLGNVAAVNSIAADDPLYSRLMMRNLSKVTIPNDELGAKIIYIICRVRWARSHSNMINENGVKVLAMGEMFGMALLDDMYLDTASADARWESIEAFINQPGVLDAAGLPSMAEYRTATAAERAAQQPARTQEQQQDDTELATAGQPGTAGGTRAVRGPAAVEDVNLLRYATYCANTDSVMGASPIMLMTTALVSFAKRGSCSTDFVAKIKNGVRADLGKDVTLAPTVVQSFYTMYGIKVPHDKIGECFEHWTRILPARALRLNITIQQAARSGLTAYYTILKALQSFTHEAFWNRIAGMFPSDWDNFKVAVQCVGDDEYYGFRRDLGHAASTKYSSLAWVAGQVCTQLGDHMLSRYLGWARPNTAVATRVNEMISSHLTQTVEADPISDAYTDMMTIVRPDM
ncbi:hypothetical protein J437_LFUL011709 [Ladona fulva]|uniref:Uncharacterized protein n=1 Tax=Ladona fulva TaxID=123851 RepID=A0A8K0KPD5_LADFU|nr:hypothetical protein J437_LFUL011709 [Ladona fulva]